MIHSVKSNTQTHVPYTDLDTHPHTHTQRWISLKWSFLYAFLWKNVPGSLACVCLLTEQLSTSKYHVPEGQGCRVSAIISVTRTKKILTNRKELWLVVRSRMCKIDGMLLQLIQVIEIHIIQSRSPEFAFCKWLIQHTRCTRGAFPLLHVQQGIVTVEVNCVG